MKSGLEEQMTKRSAGIISSHLTFIKFGTLNIILAYLTILI